MNSNFRRYLIGLLLLIGGVVSFISFSQVPISSIVSESVRDRVTQLERIYDAHGRLLSQFQKQIFDNQNDIDFLRGKIQENQHRLNQVVKRQNQILVQIDKLSNIDDSKNTTLSKQRKAVPFSITENVRTPINDKILQNSNANIDYNIAVTLVQDKSRENDAMVAFQNFVKKYPDSVYQADANYWLGQLNYKKGKRNNAESYFSSVVKNYPKSLKAPDAMLQVGVIMEDKGNKVKAKTVYQKVLEKYPYTNSAKQARKRLALIG